MPQFNDVEHVDLGAICQLRLGMTVEAALLPLHGIQHLLEAHGVHGQGDGIPTGLQMHDGPAQQVRQGQARLGRHGLQLLLKVLFLLRIQRDGMEVLGHDTCFLLGGRKAKAPGLEALGNVVVGVPEGIVVGSLKGFHVPMV